MSNFKHTSVLLTESVDALQVTKGKRYIDATAGGGGHTEEIANRGGMVLAIDQDGEAFAHLKQKFENNTRVTVAKGNFSEIREIARNYDWMSVDGVFFDLGMSSFQIDASKRGFSFSRDEALDMRMNTENNLSAYTIVNQWSQEALADIIAEYGEEFEAKKVATAILEYRADKKIETTRELAEVVRKVIHRHEKIHPATRVFQAIRIAVNDELSALKKGLGDSVELVSNGGRVAVISFHSLEDRIVKNMFREWESNGYGTVVNKKPIVADTSEVEKNPRARSAKLRIFEKK